MTISSNKSKTLPIILPTAASSTPVKNALPFNFGKKAVNIQYSAWKTFEKRRRSVRGKNIEKIKKFRQAS
jgi:hypothetical protein